MAQNAFLVRLNALSPHSETLERVVISCWSARSRVIPSDAGGTERLYPFEFYLAPATHARRVSEITRGANSDGFPVLSRLINLTSPSGPRRNGQNGKSPNVIK